MLTICKRAYDSIQKKEPADIPPADSPHKNKVTRTSGAANNGSQT